MEATSRTRYGGSLVSGETTLNSSSVFFGKHIKRKSNNLNRISYSTHWNQTASFLALLRERRDETKPGTEQPYLVGVWKIEHHVVVMPRCRGFAAVSVCSEFVHVRQWFSPTSGDVKGNEPLA